MLGRIVVALRIVALVPCVVGSGPVILVVGILRRVEPCVAVWVGSPTVCKVVPFSSAIWARRHTRTVPYEMLRASAAVASRVRLGPVVSGSGVGWLRFWSIIFLHYRDLPRGLRRFFFAFFLADCVYAPLIGF